MIILELEKKKTARKDLENCIEIFGLPKAGKTTYLKKLKAEGKRCLEWEKISLSKKLFLFLGFLFHNTGKVIYLFFKMNLNWIIIRHLELKDYLLIFRMRNSYLMSVFAKYWYARNFDGEIVTDEFFLQSAFMILQKKASFEETKKIFELVNFSRRIILIESSSNTRYARLEKIKKFARDLNERYKMAWWKNIEFNYDILKGLIFKEYDVKKSG